MKQKIYFLLWCVSFTTFSFGQSVNQEWFKNFRDKSEMHDLKVKTDNEGFIYSAGTFNSANEGTDWNLTKFNPNGDTIFTLNFNGSYDSDDFLNAIEIDEYDNIYLTGSLTTGDDESSAALIKIKSNGVIVWEKILASSDGLNEGVFILTDSLQNVFIGGNINATQNSDVFVNKYDSTGTLIWHYALSANDEQIIKGFKAYHNGNIAIVCNAFRSQNWDIVLLSLDNNGNLVFQKYFEGKNTQDDFCNDLAVDIDNNAYTVGYSINRDNKDFVTIKWNASGEIKWYALFDDKSKDDEAKSIAIFGDDVIVTGNSLNGETGSEHYDIVTIQYDYKGVQTWKQKFSGKGDGNDLAVKIAPNGSKEFIVAAQVWLNENSFDTYLLNYDIGGELLWTKSYNDSLSSDNFTSDIAIDFLGNIYVTLITQNENDTLGEIIKFNQPDKYIPVLKDFLKTLTVGLLDASSDTLVKNVIYEQCTTVIDSFYHISYPLLIEKCTSRGLNLQEVLNNKISEFFELPHKDYVDFILKRFWVLGYKQIPLLSVPHYHHFNSTQLEDDPKLAYTLEEQNYPVPCLNCNGATIDKETTETSITWLLLVGPIHWYYVNGNPLIYITSCSGQLDPSINNRCMVCPPSSYGQIPAGSGSATQNHEIEITLGQFSVQADDYCFTTINTFSSYYPGRPYVNQLAYARLMKVGYMPYYYKNGWGLPTGEYARINKVEHPIYDREYYSYQTGNYTHDDNGPNTLKGDVLSICDINTLINGLGELWCRYGLAHGIYRLDRPGINQKPVFFAFPQTQGIWFTQGPDMGIFYGTDGFINQCTSGQIEITEDYNTEQCEFCSVGPQTMPIPAADIRKYVATTDFTFLYNYWSASVISVGIRNHSGNTPAGLSGIPGLNLYDFTAVTSPTPCTPTGTLVGSLTVLSNGEYQISKDFDSNQTFSPGTVLTIHVVAKFNNSKSIDECQTITLASNNTGNPTQPFKNIVVNIRGDIKDYSSSVANYLIEIYQ